MALIPSGGSLAAWYAITYAGTMLSSDMYGSTTSQYANTFRLQVIVNSWNANTRQLNIGVRVVGTCTYQSASQSSTLSISASDIRLYGTSKTGVKTLLHSFGVRSASVSLNSGNVISAWLSRIVTLPDTINVSGSFYIWTASSYVSANSVPTLSRSALEQPNMFTLAPYHFNIKLRVSGVIKRSSKIQTRQGGAMRDVVKISTKSEGVLKNVL